MSVTVRDTYIKYRTDPDNDDKSLSYFCSLHGYNLEETRSFLSNDSNLEKDILDARRVKYSVRMKKIDDALFKAAETGDVRASELLYRRFDNWNPKLAEQETHNYYNFNDIVKGMREKKVIVRRMDADEKSTPE